MGKHLPFNVLAMLLLGSLFMQCSSSQACRDRRLLSGDEAVYFGYNDSAPEGPANWGQMNFPVWISCGSGKEQSPVALKAKDATSGAHLGALKFRYKRSNVNATLLWKDEAVEIDVNRQWSSVRIDGVKYRFHDIHFHSPSEHTIDGVRAALELHIVYADKEGNVRAVVGILYNVHGQEHDQFLHQFIEHLPKLGSHLPIIVTSVNMRSLAPEIIGEAYWRYDGSLTTPPCTESVVWTVMKQVRAVSELQFRMFSEASPEVNARPVQNLNDRKVYSWDS